MYKRQIDFKKVLAPSDGVAIVVIIVGLLIAIFLPELAIRLIGVSVAILGAVALTMLISQRLKDFVGTRFTPSSPPPSFKITDIKDNSARRQVIENFDTSFGPDREQPKRDSDEDDGQSNEFRVVGKSQKPAMDILTKPPDRSIKKDFAFSEEMSEVRIVGLKKADTIERFDTPATQPAITDETTAVEKPEDLQPVVSISDEEQIKEEIQEIQPELKDIPASIEPETLYVNVEKDSYKDEPVTQPVLTIKPPTFFDDELQKVSNEPLTQKVLENQIDLEAIKETIRKEIAEENKKLASLSATKKNYKEKPVDIQISSLIESELIAGEEPRKEFEYFLNRVLLIIRSVTSTRTAAFLLVNLEKKELILEAVATDVPDAITSKHKLPLGDDVVSQIVLNIKPEILTEINPAAEVDLIPYYTRSVGTSSFIGVPVFYNNTVIGILCADSEVVDAYDPFTVSFLGHFTKLIGALVQSYTEKYELMQASKTLNAINSFRKFAGNRQYSLEGIYESIAETAGRIFDYTNLGICSFNEESGVWSITTAKSKEYDESTIIGRYVDIEQSLTGQVLSNNKPVFVSPLEFDNIRIYKGEPDLSGGFFVAVPIKSLTNTYGVLFLEGRNQSSVTSYDVNILENLSDNAGTSIENIFFMNMLQNSSLVDTSTGILNPPAFYQRLEEELFKANDFKYPLTLCLFKLDNYASFDPVQYRERMEHVYYHVLNIVKKNIKPYHIFGRVDDDTFGIVLSGMKLQDAQRGAERLRLEVARSFIEFDKKRFTVTISIGIAEASVKDTTDEILVNSSRVLEVALQKGNSVCVF